jgi:hypothetical protein
VGNAFIWWLSLPAMGYAAFRGFWRGDRRFQFLAVMALGLWLVWPLAHANTSFMHYMLEAIPFVCVTLALALEQAWGSLGNLGPVVVGAHAFLVAWWFWYYQPLLSAGPITVPQYLDHLWLGQERWDLMAQIKDYRHRVGIADEAKFREYLKQTNPDAAAYLKALSGWEAPAGLPEARSNLVKKPSPRP